MKNTVFAALAVRLMALFFGLTSLCMLYSCQPGPDDPTYTLSGEAVNISGRGIPGATVSLWRAGESTASHSATTDGEGQYRIFGVLSGTYELRIEAEGYLVFSEEVTITGDQLDRSDLVLGSAVIRGQVIDSQTGRGLAGAEVAFSINGDTARVSITVVAITDASGNYVITDAPVGVFVQVVRADGFFVRVIEDVEIGPDQNQLGMLTLVQGVTEGTLRIVLTWGATPRDLDSHLTGPMSGGGRFHCYFLLRSPVEGVALDVDDVSGFGPETITISAFNTGTYRYSVFNFSDRSATGSAGIASSPAKVEVYGPEGLLATFNPPVVTPGNTWRVFEIEVESNSIAIVPVNTFVTAANSSDMSTFRTEGKVGFGPEAIETF